MRIVNELISYAKIHLGLNKFDETYIANQICEIIGCTYSIDESEVDNEYIMSMNTPDLLIDKLVEVLHIHDQDVKSVERQVTKIMGLLSLMPSNYESKFWETYNVLGYDKALDDLYDYQIKNNYIQKSKIDRNLKWTYLYKDIELLITINRAKPEKDNKEAIQLLNKEEEKYPKCLLCYENLGFQGNCSHPARQNLRPVNFVLDGDEFFLQFSPYLYFDKHFIVISKEHYQMKQSEKTIRHLTDFVDIFPNSFLGQNAPLPIIGATIINHEHYQGGTAKLPIMEARDRFIAYKDKELTVSYLDFDSSTVKVISRDKEKFIEVMNRIMATFKDYDNTTLGVLSKTTNQHNAVTPIVRSVNGNYEGYLVLRNNRISIDKPEGIFHVREKNHHIKKESIGLIEAMGLFILPGRLANEIEDIKDCIKCGKVVDKPGMLHKYVVDNFVGNRLEDVIKEYIGEVCKEILCDIAIFKDTATGNKAAAEFLAKINY